MKGRGGGGVGADLRHGKEGVGGVAFLHEALEIVLHELHHHEHVIQLLAHHHLHSSPHSKSPCYALTLA